MSPSRESDDLRELRDLARDVPPPPELEDRVVDELRRRDLVRTDRASERAAWRRWVAMAAGLLLAALGGWVARGVVEAAPDAPQPRPASEVAETAQKEFLVLLSEPEGLDTEKNLTELVDEYGAWAGRLAADGRMVTGRRLESGAIDLVRGASGEIETSTTPLATEATGFFLVRAADLESARALVADCPHLGYGGKISLSEVARGAG